jgi:hypothetical protein
MDKEEISQQRRDERRNVDWPIANKSHSDCHPREDRGRDQLDSVQL